MLNPNISKRLKTYTAAAGAVLATGSIAEAQVVYSDVPDQVGVDSIAVDFNNDGTTDLIVKAGRGVIVPESKVVILQGECNGSNYMNFYPFVNNAGAGIGYSNNFANFYANQILVQPMNSSSGAYGTGFWQGVDTSFLGVRFMIGSNTHYGWVRMSVSAAAPYDLSLFDFGYNPVPDATVFCGDTTGCLASTMPMITGDVTTCIGENLSFSVVSGYLNGGDNWVWHSGSCSGPIIGTGPTISLVASTNEFIYANAEGGCAPPSVCDTVQIIIGDMEPPTVICPGDFNVSMNADFCGAIVEDYSVLLNISDNCDPSPMYSQMPSPGDTIYSNMTVEMFIMDANSNTSSCFSYITPVDDIAPLVSCAGDITVQVDGNCSYMIPDFIQGGMVTATDNCDGNPLIVQSPSPGTIVTATTTIGFTASDYNTNMGTCNFNLILSDSIAPVLTVPSDISVCASGSVVTYNAPAATDSCSIASLTQIAGLASGSDFPVGVTTNTFVAEDMYGNTDTASFSVTVLEEFLITSDVTICSGDSVFAEGNWNFAAGVYYDTLVSSNGCDSVLITNLIVNSVYSTPEYIMICAGDSAFLQGSWQTGAGMYYDTLSSVNGCDSIINTTLIINALPVPVVDSVSNASCLGDADGAIFISASGVAPLSYIWSNGSTSEDISAIAAGDYYVTVSDANGCENTLFVQLQGSILPSLAGIVYYQTDIFDAGDAVVQLYTPNASSDIQLDFVTSQPIQTGGYFSFADLNPGDYYVRIDLVDEAGHPNNISTYYPVSHTWDFASPVTLNCDSIVNVSVELFALPPATGTGSISGTIHYWIVGTKALGDPVPGAEVYIEQEPNDEPKANTETDINGEYTVGGLLEGDGYKMRVDIPGYPQISTYSNISITAGTPVIENLDFLVDSSDVAGGIYADTITSVGSLESENFVLEVYPNPVSDLLKIEYSLKTEGVVNIQITDQQGKIMYNNDMVKQDKGHHQLGIETNSYSSGIYYLVFRMDKTVYLKKIVKK